MTAGRPMEGSHAPMAEPGTTSFSVTAAAFRGGGSPAGPPPTVSGFVVSPFPPLIHDVVHRCLRDPADFDAGRPSGPPGPAPADRRGDRTAIVLGTVFGDSVTSDTICQRLASGRVHNPMLFFQSVPTSVLGHLCQEYAITGPVACLSVRGDALPGELLDAAGAVLDEGVADEVLLIGVELAPTARVEQALRETAGGADHGIPHTDTASALLLRRAVGEAEESRRRLDRSSFDGRSVAGNDSPYGWQDALVRVCEGLEPVTTGAGNTDRRSRP